MHFAKHKTYKCLHPRRLLLSVQKAHIQGQEFTPINLFTASDHLVEREKHAGVLAISFVCNTFVEPSLESLVKNKPDAIQLSVPYFGRTLMMDLVRVGRFFLPDFQTFTEWIEEPSGGLCTGVFYRGIVDGDAFNPSLRSLFSRIRCRHDIFFRRWQYFI